KDGNVVEEWVSSDEAHEIKGLKTGVEYTLKETVAPDGYTVASETTFTIDETGKVTSTGTVTEDGVMLVENAKTGVKVSKTDIADGAELEGATIQVLDKDGKVVEEWVSTEEAHEIEGLKTCVEYTLKETVAPDGYTVASETTFTIDETGKVTSTGTVTEDGVMLVENAKTVVLFARTDEDGTELLEGATLQITDPDGKVVTEWTSAKSSHKVEGLKTGVEYTLKETLTPDDCTKAADVKFTIDASGTLTTTADTTAEAGTGNPIVIVKGSNLTTCTVTWENYDGEVLETDEDVPLGTMPSYDGEEPEKPADAQYTYIFSGWAPAVVAADGDAVYTAQFTETLKTCTITWENYDGEVLETDEDVPLGTTPSYDGEEPEKPADEQYSYIFSGWDPEVAPADGDAVYTAQFTEELTGGIDNPEFTVTWIIEGRMETETYRYGELPSHAVPTKPFQVFSYYIFEGWSPAVVPVTEDAVYTAVFSWHFVPIFLFLPKTQSDDGENTDTTATPPGDMEEGTPDPMPFADVTSDSPAYDDIRFVYENGIMNGVSDMLFDPHGSLTRGMIVTILWRIEGRPEIGYSGTFSDVPAGEWYTDGVEWAASHGIVLGFGDGTYGPDKPVTREQVAVILYRYAQFKGVDTSVGEDTNILSYDDAFDISSWAFPAMQWACGTDILDSGNTAAIRPGEPASRAEIARAIRVYLEDAAK
ncbi:MAG: S-layer homology domain-containing protein, partial [Clostridia bacterium]|nr:S-layer homology domain-containing protein [Clostridia bacterium]